MTSLYDKSIQIIKEGQSSTGAYIASPNFPTYQYCWLRDGSFIAYAMDRAGEHASAEAFFRWVGQTIQRYGDKVDGIKLHLDSGLPIGKDDVLHTRYTLDGSEDTVDSAWGNFQIDGYGTWLWALAEHIRLSGNVSLLRELRASVEITLRYLSLVWQLPNYDCWEEHPEYIHSYSLATVYAGFNRLEQLQKKEPDLIDPIPLQALASEVRDYILKYAVKDGCLVKHIWSARDGDDPRPVQQSGVDSSMIGVAVPYQVFPLNDPVMEKTLKIIEADLLRPGGGLYRYKADVYYGGGEWILLTAWLGWYYVKLGRIDEAAMLQKWIESQATGEGFLPEQVSQHKLAPAHYAPWLKKWGPVASPLLWSHAMYIILIEELNQARLK